MCACACACACVCVRAHARVCMRAGVSVLCASVRLYMCTVDTIIIKQYGGEGGNLENIFTLVVLKIIFSFIGIYIYFSCSRFINMGLISVSIYNERSGEFTTGMVTFDFSSLSVEGYLGLLKREVGRGGGGSILGVFKGLQAL